MTVKVTPDTRLAVLDRVPFVISSAFLVGRVTPSAVECVLDGARVKVTHAAIRGDSPRVTTLPGFRRLEDFAREYLDISVIGRITPVTAIDWQRRLAGQYLAMTLPEGLTTDDLYPGLRELSPQKAAFHSYVLGSVPAPDEPGIAIEVAHERTSELKAEYGALLSDVVYRISNPALFDATVPESREFHLLLMQWDDAVSEATDEDLDALSRELTLAFSTARAHAERVGMDHLPWRARGTARKAAKAAAVARGADSDGERAAARATVAKLLRGLGLHYLPLPDEAPLMLGGVRPSLEPGRAPLSPYSGHDGIDSPTP